MTEIAVRLVAAIAFAAYAVYLLLKIRAELSRVQIAVDRSIERMPAWRLALLNLGLRLVTFAERRGLVGDEFIERVRSRWQAPRAPRVTEQ